MKKLLFLMPVMVLYLICCTNIEKQKGHFSRNDFKDSTMLKGEIIDFNPVVDGILYYVIKDTLLFINTLHGSPCYMEVYGLHSRKALFKFAQRGNGPYEYLGCYLKYNSNNDKYLCLFDVVMKRMALYNVDSLIKQKSYYIPKQIQLPDYTLNITYLDSNTILGYNFYHFQSTNIKNDAECLFKTSINEKFQIKNNNEKNSFFTANVSCGGIFVSPVSDQIWVADYHKDKINIYNKKLKYVKTMIGPDKIEPKYIVEENNMVSFKNHKQYSGYYSGFLTDSAIYLLYQGVNGIPGNRDYHKPVEVFKISWNGALLNRYMLDMWVNEITLDSDEKYIYGSAERADGMGQLVRFKLK